MLAERNYHAKSNTDKAGLQRQLKRTDMGLLSYVDCTNNELRDFIRSRGVDKQSIRGKLGQREELLRALEYQDYHPKFEKFTSLPSELRTQIYEYYFAGFQKRAHAPQQPPLTLTCRLIRDEALPLFYSSCTFEFNILQPGDATGRATSRKVIIPRDMLIWLHSTRAEYLADIQHVRVNLWRYECNSHDTGKSVKLLWFSLANPKTVEFLETLPPGVHREAQGQIRHYRLADQVADFVEELKRLETVKRAGLWRKRTSSSYV